MVGERKDMTIGVFFGGRSPEHEVSIITGQLVISELQKLGYPVIPVYIDKQGRWFFGKELGYLKFFTEGNLDEKLARLKKCFVEVNATRRALVLRSEGMFPTESVIGLAFPTFHGMNGEDGTIQGVFELANVSYVGCGVAASALALDKVLTKQLYRSAGVSTTPFVSFTSDDWQSDQAGVVASVRALRWPVFVKPARLGSSIGIAKVRKPEDLESACEVALHYDTKVIIEESVENVIDITCAVLGNEDPIPSLIQEALFQGEHFSFEDKYLEEGGAQLGNAEKKIVIPARLSDERTEEVRALAVKIFKLFDCSGIARVDFLYDKQQDKVYVNEINTLPGTLYHHLWKVSGVGIGMLLERLIMLAQERYMKKNSVTMTFASDLLRFANSVKLRMDKKE